MKSKNKWVLLSNDGAESCSLHLDVPVDLLTDGRDFSSNVFPFSIAISPNHEHLSASGLRKQVPLDALGLVRDFGLYRCLEQIEGVARLPSSIVG